jgi:hypothetical protein
MSTNAEFAEESWELEGVLCYYEDWLSRCNHHGCKANEDAKMTLEEFAGKTATLFFNEETEEFYYG